MADLNWEMVLGGVVGATTSERSVALNATMAYELVNLTDGIIYGSLDGTAVETTTAEKAGKIVLDQTSVSKGRPLRIANVSELRVKMAASTAQLQILRLWREKIYG